jgi:hypothetical protein
MTAPRIYADLVRENAELQTALDEIGRLALGCWMDMQGRLVDDTHKRAHDVLGSIARRAAVAFTETAT